MTEIMKEEDKGKEERRKEKEELDLHGKKVGQINEKRQHRKSWRAQLISYCPFP